MQGPGLHCLTGQEALGACEANVQVTSLHTALHLGVPSPRMPPLGIQLPASLKLHLFSPQLTKYLCGVCSSRFGKQKQTCGAEEPHP